MSVINQFILSIVAFLVIGFTVYGLFADYSEKKDQEFYSEAYAKGYEDGIKHREYDDNYTEFDVDMLTENR